MKHTCRKNLMADRSSGRPRACKRPPVAPRVFRASATARHHTRRCSAVHSPEPQSEQAPYADGRG
eukprot:895791-Alexandrium_andersonii.AAC.1